MFRVPSKLFRRQIKLCHFLLEFPWIQDDIWIFQVWFQNARARNKKYIGKTRGQHPGALTSDTSIDLNLAFSAFYSNHQGKTLFQSQISKLSMRGSQQPWLKTRCLCSPDKMILWGPRPNILTGLCLWTFVKKKSTNSQSIFTLQKPTTRPRLRRCIHHNPHKYRVINYLLF